MVPTRCNEGGPRSVIEAYAAGVPVIATALGALPEMIEHDVTGMLVPSGSAQAWIEAAVPSRRIRTARGSGRAHSIGGLAFTGPRGACWGSSAPTGRRSGRRKYRRRRSTVALLRQWLSRPRRRARTQKGTWSRIHAHAGRRGRSGARGPLSVVSQRSPHSRQHPGGASPGANAGDSLPRSESRVPPRHAPPPKFLPY